MTFIRQHKEFEPIGETTSFNRNLIEDYKSRELNRNTLNMRVVYDCMDNNSPYYD